MRKSNQGKYDDLILKVLVILLIISSIVLTVCFKIYADREGLFQKIKGKNEGYYTVIIEGNTYDDKLSSIINSIITEDMNDYDKYKIIHDFVVRVVDYDYSALNDIEAHKLASDPEYVLETGWGICGGYARLYRDICNKAGLNCEVVTGWADFLDDDTGHAWNAVKLTGNVYHVDCCWDDVAAEDDKYDWFLQGNNYVTNGCRKWTGQFDFSSESYPITRSKLVPYAFLIKYQVIEEES